VSVSDAVARELGPRVRLRQPAEAAPYRLHERREAKRTALAILLFCVVTGGIGIMVALSQRSAATTPVASVITLPDAVVATAVAAVADPPQATPAPLSAATDVSAPLVAAAPVPPVVSAPTGARLRIPRIGVDAPMQTLGLAANGQMPAPTDDSSVAWYDFSAAPGGPGNALLAGHVDWVDHAAVFWHLRTLVPGDAISVTSGGQTFMYVVDRVYSVPFDLADTSGIVGRRSGPPTLTIVTCAGTFNTARHLYDQRLVVVGSLRS
jgi:LPXTG-site transpeptidase (sortase) family protein